ncbi:MAG: hypothetical protein GKS00_18255 [Alphaproteobacteria bacterium]|nr:hypothetical protein [Alphaproteobacteria bacterium]
MASNEFVQEWAWLIAIGLSVGLVGLLLAIRRMQAYQAHKRAIAAARAGEAEPTEIRANFLRARRNFLILLGIVIVFFVTLEIWNLYFVLER